MLPGQSWVLVDWWLTRSHSENFGLSCDLFSMWYGGRRLRSRYRLKQLDDLFVQCGLDIEGVTRKTSKKNIED
jgi:hypothetical protein